MGSTGTCSSASQPEHPRIFQSLPRLHCNLLLPNPPPIEKLGGLMEACRLESAGSHIYTFRDDLSSPISPGGNKVRKLQYALPFAMATRKATPTAIATCGGFQSNCCRITAQVAAKLGMKCFTLLDEADADDKTDTYRSSGNIQLLRLLGAKIEYMSAHDQTDDAPQIEFYKRQAEAFVNRVEEQGETVVYVPPGASGMLGNGLGHAECVFDILRQQQHLGLAGSGRFDYIVLASASGSTVAGFVAGLKLAKATGWLQQDEQPAVVIGIEAAGDAVESHTQRALDAARETVKLLGLSEDVVSEDDIHIDGRWLGPGYGDCDEAVHRTMLQAARCEGLFLDPVYTSKAMHAIVQGITDGELSGNILFVHTGGQPVMSAYPGIEEDEGVIAK